METLHTLYALDQMPSIVLMYFMCWNPKIIRITIIRITIKVCTRQNMLLGRKLENTPYTYSTCKGL